MGSLDKPKNRLKNALQAATIAGMALTGSAAGDAALAKESLKTVEMESDNPADKVIVDFSFLTFQNKFGNFFVGKQHKLFNQFIGVFAFFKKYSNRISVFV